MTHLIILLIFLIACSQAVTSPNHIEEVLEEVLEELLSSWRSPIEEESLAGCAPIPNGSCEQCGDPRSGGKACERVACYPGFRDNGRFECVKYDDSRCQGDSHSLLGGRIKVAYAMCDGTPNAIAKINPKLGWSCKIGLLKEMTFALPCSGTICTHTFNWGLSFDSCDAFVLAATMGAGHYAAASAKAFTVGTQSSNAVVRSAQTYMQKVAQEQAGRIATAAAKKATGGLCDAATDTIAVVLNCLKKGVGDDFSDVANPLIKQLNKVMGSASMHYTIDISWDTSKTCGDHNAGNMGCGVTVDSEIGFDFNFGGHSLGVGVPLTAIGAAQDDIGVGCKTKDWTNPKLAYKLTFYIYPFKAHPHTWNVKIYCKDASIFAISAKAVEKAYDDAKDELTDAAKAVGAWGVFDPSIGSKIDSTLDDIGGVVVDVAKTMTDPKELTNVANQVGGLFKGKRRGRRGFRRNLDDEESELSSNDDFLPERLLSLVLSQLSSKQN